MQDTQKIKDEKLKSSIVIVIQAIEEAKSLAGNLKSQ
jgi:hypothetical protein